MPKKTAYSRSGAQRSKSRQKSFELVRPVSEESELETAESSEGANVVDTEDAEVETAKEPEAEVEERGAEVKEKVGKRASTSAKGSAPTPVATAPASSAPRSASARLAARRQAAQKTQRSSTSLIVAENYGYVRKDLVFILILAIIMFSVIIALHFILGS